MDDIITCQNGGTVPLCSKQPIIDLETRLFDAMLAAGVTPPRPGFLVIDGRWNRWYENGKKGGPLWGRGFTLNNGHIVFTFGDHRLKSSHTFRSWECGNSIDPNEAQRLLDEFERRRNLADEENAKAKARTAQRDTEIWNHLPKEGETPYLTRKGVGAYGVRFGADWHGNYIAVPMRNIDGTMTAFQRIYDDGRKDFPRHASKKASFHLIGQLNPDGVLYLVEGYATGATVHEATKAPVACCFDAGNLGAVAGALREIYPDLKLVMAADNDQWKASDLGPDGKPKGNPGVSKAYEVARKHSGTSR